VYLPNCL